MNDEGIRQDHDEVEERRTLLAGILAVVAGAITAVVPLVAGLVTLFDPVLRKGKKPGAFQGASGAQQGFVRLAAVDAIPADGRVRRIAVRVDQLDAWNFTPDYPVGAVYVRRDADTDAIDAIQVLQATCPHAGCSVAPSADGSAFHCPCHNSAFDLTGQRITKAGKENPSPRNMDVLEVDAEQLAAGEVWVRYQDFVPGIEERKVKL